ncbi:MAG: transglycosylase SLT domain-containing protein [Woeseiaceae bacterium]|nr:transglycosylase SLT domain-containing protein [Woeseiaceae bacterium]
MLALAPATAGASSDPDDILLQRELFLRVFEDVERGDWSVVWDLKEPEREALSRYVLWPDLRATYLRATMKRADTADVESFLDEYGTLKPARELRYRYALELARRNELDAYHDIYQAFYQGSEVARLDCLALRAELADGRERELVTRARDLWLVGKSQADECDPVFEHLIANGYLGALDYRRRYALAVDERNFTLARWLGKSIDDAHATEARRWLAAQSDPEAFIERHAVPPTDAATRAQLAYAIEQLTYDDPQAALRHWRDMRLRIGLSEEQKLDTARHIALWTARDRLPGAHKLLSTLPAAARDPEVMRWRARTSIREGQWRRLKRDIDAMPEDERASEEWRYWRAVALQETGARDAARAEFTSLAAERSYYGFLAADAVDAPYALEAAGLTADETRIAELAGQHSLVRARELYKVGLDGRGRSEWDAAIAWLDAGDKYQAAILAHRWGWHSRAIATVARVGEYDDLSLRYPLPYQAEFEQHAGTARIATTWAYGIARSESLFMRDIRSSAGAVGLMQLMPATGRGVAAEIGLPYQGLDTLTDPQANIRLGTTYLGQMAERYGGNTVLATAAYNAGPHRVDRWRPVGQRVDTLAWIENIPFNETRRYVRRVMAAEAIFHWRLTGELRRLSDALPPVVEPAASDEQLASR